MEPARTTIDEIVTFLGDRIGKGAEELRSELAKQGLGQNDLTHFRSQAFFIECLLFEWFATDVMIPSEFGVHADAIRSRCGFRPS